MKTKSPVMTYIKKIGRSVFTTREIADLSGKSISTTTQALNHLARHNIIMKVYRGLWIEITNKAIGPHMLIPHLFGTHRVYLSFLSALHLHGIIGQVPRIITVASAGHSRLVKTRLATFQVHRISPDLFTGFDWSRPDGTFLVAEPEKALIDCLYLSVKKKKQYSYFPELDLKDNFNYKKARKWVNIIRDPRTRILVLQKLENILASNL